MACQILTLYSVLPRCEAGDYVSTEPICFQSFRRTLPATCVRACQAPFSGCYQLLAADAGDAEAVQSGQSNCCVLNLPPRNTFAIPLEYSRPEIFDDTQLDFLYCDVYDCCCNISQNSLGQDVGLLLSLFLHLRSFPAGRVSVTNGKFIVRTVEFERLFKHQTCSCPSTICFCDISATRRAARLLLRVLRTQTPRSALSERDFLHYGAYAEISAKLYDCLYASSEDAPSDDEDGVAYDFHIGSADGL